MKIINHNKILRDILIVALHAATRHAADIQLTEGGVSAR